MRPAQIGYMNIITNARSIQSRIIGSEDFHGIAKSSRRLQQEWNQMRFGLMPFTDLARRTCARGIEVTEDDRSQAVGTVKILEDALYHQFARTIGVYGPLRVVLRHRYRLGKAIG